MKVEKKMFNVGDCVKVIKESKTTGLLGAQLKVVLVNKDSVEVAIGNKR